MPKLFLHVGLHKTGTSAVQRNLHQNSVRLFENGYFYPEPDVWGAHHELVALLRIHNDGSLMDSAAEADFLSKLEIYKVQADGRDIIISSEVFSECVHRAVVGKLRGMFESVSVVVYLRRQDTLLESVHNQMLKQAAIRADDVLKVAFYEYDHNFTLEHWSSFVGEENMIVRRFEESRLSGGDIFLDFLQAIDAQVDVRKLDLQASRVNESLSMIEYMVLDRLASAETPDWDSAVEATQKIVKDRYGGRDCGMVGNYLTYAERIAFLEIYEERNAKVLAKYFPDDEDLFSSPISPFDVRRDAALLKDVSSAYAEVLLELAARLPGAHSAVQS